MSLVPHNDFYGVVYLVRRFCVKRSANLLCRAKVKQEDAPVLRQIFIAYSLSFLLHFRLAHMYSIRLANNYRFLSDWDQYRWSLPNRSGSSSNLNR